MKDERNSFSSALSNFITKHVEESQDKGYYGVGIGNYLATKLENWLIKWVVRWSAAR